ncbi:MAG TPA: M20/M25/M40 family metallo-hydrolase [Thermomicrobiaceae bacterium]|nr:M20/M25/M40 family metallo-hydrolase [Thermomicrobiaceae bacterium]
MVAPERARPRLGARTLAWPSHAGRWLPAVAVLLLVAGSLWLGGAQYRPPAALPTDAPATAFSGERALVDLAAFAQAPRPMGSAAHAEAEQYLVDQLRAMGLQPEVQAATGTAVMDNGSVWAGSVRNVVARVPGTASTGAVLLAAHYDTVPTGPGAGDCGSCVATVLETVRALRAGPPLANDVIVLFADAEEHDMLGAKTFMAQHPWASEVRVAFNFEALTPGGATLVNYVAAGHGQLTDAFLGAVPHPLVSSFITGLGFGYDATQYASGGAAGFEMTHFDTHLSAYHSALDTASRVDPRSLQDNGSYLLAATRAVGNLNLAAPESGARVFFNLAPGLAVSYSTALIWPFTALAVALLAGALVLGFRRRRVTVGGLGLGFGAFLVGALGSVLLVGLAQWALRALDSNYQAFLIGIAYHGEILLGAFLALSLALTAAVGTWARRRAGSAGLATGAALGWALVTVGASVVLPGGGYLFTWPLVGAALALGWLFLRPERGASTGLTVGTMALVVVPSVALLTPVVLAVAAVAAYLGAQVELPMAPLPIALAALGFGLVLPWLPVPGGRARWGLPAAAALAALLLVGFGVARSGFDVSQPRPDQIAYVLDADRGQASWISVGDRSDAYTAQFFTGGATRTTFAPMPSEQPDRTFPALETAAPVVDLPSPVLTVTNDLAGPAGRTIQLHLTSPRGAPNVQLELTAPGGIDRLVVAGRTVDLGGAARTSLTLQYYGLPANGVDLTLGTAGVGPVTAAIEDRSNGLPDVPGMTVRPRPATTMPAPFENSDPTIVRSTSSF